MFKIIDISGKRFNKLTAIKFAYRVGNNYYWLFRCDCGNEKIILKNNVIRGITKSCGCLKTRRVYNEKRRKKINGIDRQEFFKRNIAAKKIFNIYNSIIHRCYNKNCYNYKWYGERGVFVCEEWKNNFLCFYNWCIENGYDIKKDRKEQTLDRINPYGNYCPENCRFITIQEQQKNKSNNIKIEYNGEIKNLREWCNILGKNYNTIYRRVVIKKEIFKKAIA